MMSEIQLKVGGMACEGCASAVKNAVTKAEPAARVEVELSSKTVKVAGATSPEAVKAAIAKAGYEILP
jgi:copper chaperone